jgi:DNA-binding transcriptional LysR family regulator
VICAAPSYLEKAGIPKTIGELDAHNCLSAGAQDLWRLEGPEGQRHIRVKGNIRSNSAELIREALLSGLGLGLRSTWEIGAELQSGALQVVLPKYRGSSKVAIYAVYPSRDFMPAKVNAFIEFLSGHFGIEPYWDKSVEIGEFEAPPPVAAKASRRPVAPKQSVAKKQGLHTDAH